MLAVVMTCCLSKARVTYASCLPHQAAFANGGHKSNLPPSPTLYLFDPVWSPRSKQPPPTVTSPQGPLEVTLMWMTERPGYRVFRVRLAQPDPKVRRLRVDVRYSVPPPD